MCIFFPLERSEANMELFLLSFVVIEHKKTLLLRNAERSWRVLFFYNKKLEAEMLRASLLIYLDTSPILNCVRKLSVRYAGCWKRDVCWSGILCFSVTVTDEHVGAFECNPALLGRNTNCSCSMHFPALLEDSYDFSVVLLIGIQFCSACFSSCYFVIC